ncbi:MAG: DNA-directed RNA polymerase subunit alpha C-terminal domain-containing protein, partial [Planctomycetota bacterium]|nr:DNA-directed RNA polymerase subunit alpha C-terminal domain-containing protein [Planctomycetota bacterium]
IYRKHLNPIVLFGASVDAEPVVEDPSASEFNQDRVEVNELSVLLDQSISELELSVRARNCLDGANLTTLGALVSLSENEVMHLKNLGKTSLTEIKSKLAEKGLSLGMTAQ